jgi:hypothetical protein
MKKHLTYLFRSLFLLTLSATWISGAQADSQSWKALILPASLNKDHTVKLLSNNVQVLTLALQASKDVTSQGDDHQITLDINLPQGMSVLESGGVYTVNRVETPAVQDNRSVTQFDVQVKNKYIISAPGASFNSDWINQAIFVRTPQEVPEAQRYIDITINDGKSIQQARWPLSLSPLTPVKNRPKQTMIGLWDYNYVRVEGADASNGLAQFLQDSGVGYIEWARSDAYRKALQNCGIIIGGQTHQDFFFSGAHRDYNSKGVAAKGGFADPQSIIDLPADAAVPGVKTLVANAKENGGYATFDYEPNGVIGFSPTSVAAFKTKYHVADADFETFQKYVAEHGLHTFQTTDPLIKDIWKKWTDFRSDTTSAYIGRIYQAFKKEMPEGKLLITPSRSFGRDSLRALALGCDNAAMAKYADVIMPQLYSGYGAANAKLVMQMTEGWRQEIKEEGANTKLWPLLLVRYSGAGIYNSPQRLYQQMIGSIAHGANGVLFYYPSNMDAPYWQMLARANNVIAKYEDYYQDGKRVDNQFALSDLPAKTVNVDMYPYYQEVVNNPDWSFTAHQLDSKVLLTLINLDDVKPVTFGVNINNAKVLSSQNVTLKSKNHWRVEPGEIGFVMLDKS